MTYIPKAAAAAVLCALLLSACTPAAGSPDSADTAATSGTPAAGAASGAAEPASGSPIYSLGPTASPDGDTATARPSYTDAEAPGFVTAAPVRESYPADSPSVQIRLYNSGEKDYIYGEPFLLERQQGDTWETVPFRADTAFNSIACLLPPGGEGEETYSLDCFDQPLTPGTYRLSVGITDYTVGCTFRLE